MTKLWILSDLHVNFHQTRIRHVRDYFPEHDFLIAAGDISENIEDAKYLTRELTDKPIIQIAGNHEYYHRLYQQEINNIQNHGSHYFLENSTVILDNIRFIGCTLWTDFNLYETQEKSIEYIAKFLNDFRYIYYGDRMITPDDIIKIHEDSKNFIISELEKNFDGKTIVITHHAPSKKSLNSRFKGNPINPAFINNLDWLIKKYEPDIWIHGHTHSNFDYKIGKTRVICNPKGYGNENSEYNPRLVVDI